MRLRTQILVFLLLFGLAPLLLAFAINIPLVFNSLELLYHKAHLQNLRADFRDLDQHIASRVEMVRLLAKLRNGSHQRVALLTRGVQLTFQLRQLLAFFMR